MKATLLTRREELCANKHWKFQNNSSKCGINLYSYWNVIISRHIFCLTFLYIYYNTSSLVLIHGKQKILKIAFILLTANEFLKSEDLCHYLPLENDPTCGPPHNAVPISHTFPQYEILLSVDL
jgi:hypothetical protein